MSRTVALVLVVAMIVAVISAVTALILLSRQALARPSASDPAASLQPAPPHRSFASGLSAHRPGRQVFRPTSSKESLQLLDYHYFVVGYDNSAQDPAWVTYDLDGPISHPGHEAKRPQKFASEERTTAHVRHEDYNRSGYDRGHLCPSYAMFSRFGVEGEDATFVMTNVIPQVHSLNAGLWEELEKCIGGQAGMGGGWAESLRHLTVINGPVFAARHATWPNGIAVPDACFSIVLEYREEQGDYRALAFEMPDRDGVVGPLDRYLVSIKRIEEETGLDIFAGVDQQLRAEVEDRVADAVWPEAISMTSGPDDATAVPEARLPRTEGAARGLARWLPR